MACLSPLSSARGRRLFELLEEKQEPFALDIYLKENGQSDRLLSPFSMCWPGNACKRMQRTASHGFRKVRCGLFKCMLSKFLRGNSIRKALRWDDKAPDNRSLGKSRSSSDTRVSKIKDGEEEEDEASDLQFSSSTGSISGGVTDEEALWKCLEEDESKQHSPVSVLGLHSCEGSPVHVNQNINGEGISTFSIALQRKALDIFEELLQVAYTPAFEQLTKSDVLQRDQPQKLPGKEVEERIVYSHECSKHNRSLIHDEVIPCEGDLGAIGRLVVSEVSNSWRNWIPFQSHVTDTGVQVDDEIFECLVEEAALEMLTGFPCTFSES